MAGWPANSPPQSAAWRWSRLTAPGISRWSAAKSSSVRTSIRTGVFAVPIRRASLSEPRSEEHTSELQSRLHLVCRLLLEKKKKNKSEFERTTLNILQTTLQYNPIIYLQTLLINHRHSPFSLSATVNPRTLVHSQSTSLY